MKKLLATVVLLGLGVAIPLSISASWQLKALWVVIGVAAAGYVLLSDPIRTRVPWTIRRKNPELDQSLGAIARRHVLRGDLQSALHRLLNDLKTPTLAELRAFASNLAKRLRNEGFAASADTVAVQLPDNADAQAVRNRRDEIQQVLVQLLLWDSYQ
jgi:hypothetical protein